MNAAELRQRLPLPYDRVDVGIGNVPSGNPDWAFAGNAGEYKSKRLRVLVHCAGTNKLTGRPQPRCGWVGLWNDDPR